MHNSTCVYLCRGSIAKPFLFGMWYTLADLLNVPSAWIEPQNILVSIHHLLFFQWPTWNGFSGRKVEHSIHVRDQPALLCPMGGLPRTGLVARAVELLLHLLMEKPRNESATFLEQNSAHSEKELRCFISPFCRKYMAFFQLTLHFLTWEKKTLFKWKGKWYFSCMNTEYHGWFSIRSIFFLLRSNFWEVFS